MQIVTDLRRFKASPVKPLILALGNFDGFHRGHQELLRYVVAKARKKSACAAVMTFRDHPHSILHPHRKPLMLTSVEQKLFFLAQAGMDLCFLLPFTPEFAAISPDDFVEKILVRQLHVLEVCMGYDAHFGKGRKGDTSLMTRLALRYGFALKKMDPVFVGRQPVSSTRIRSLLMRGKTQEAQKCLGRPFSMFGRVVCGKGHGTSLGFPTVNLEVHSEIVLPLGVYAASGRFLPERLIATQSGKLKIPRQLPDWIPGAMNFGKRPTYPASETPRPVLELHLLGFQGQVYGEMMEVALHRFLRPEEKFPCEADLKTQIQRDVRKAEKFYQKGVFNKIFTFKKM